MTLSGAGTLSAVARARRRDERGGTPRRDRGCGDIGAGDKPAGDASLSVGRTHAAQRSQRHRRVLRPRRRVDVARTSAARRSKASPSRWRMGSTRSRRRARAIDALSVIGGGSRSRFWGRIIAAALARPLVYHARRRDRTRAGRGATRTHRVGAASARRSLSARRRSPHVIEPVDARAGRATASSRALTSRALFRRLYADLRSDASPRVRRLSHRDNCASRSADALSSCCRPGAA